MTHLGHVHDTNPSVGCTSVGQTGQVTSVKTQSDVWVPDCVVLDEIELYGELIIAASASDRRLTQSEIDAVLGVAPRLPMSAR